MRLGTIHSFQASTDSTGSIAATYADSLDLISRSEELGYDWVNLTEHHVTDHSYCPAVMPMLAAVASRTTRIGLSTGMLILPLHNPVRIAEEAAVIDNLSRGRLTLGVAAGYRKVEFDALGSEFAVRGKRLDESLEVLRLAWAGEPFSYQGETISVPDVTVSPVPYQGRQPEIWIGGTSRPALERAARQGSPPCPGALTKIGEFEAIRSELRRSRQRVGRPEGSDDMIVARFALAAESTKEARRIALPAIQEVFRRYQSLGASPAIQDVLRDWDLLDQYVIVGSESKCRDRLEQLRALGVGDLMLQVSLPGVSNEQALESLERFSRVGDKLTSDSAERLSRRQPIVGGDCKDD